MSFVAGRSVLVSYESLVVFEMAHMICAVVWEKVW